MNKYIIYKHPTGQMEAVKQGWSWPAFFLSPFWALYKKMWGLGFGVLILEFVIYGRLGSSSSAISFADVLSMIISIVFGMQGNLWRVSKLESRGFDYVETVVASSPDGAIAIHLKGQNNSETSKEPFFS
jgi:hypothetical protein